MNTVSTDLPTEVSEQLQTLFAAAQTTLAQRQQAALKRNADAFQKEQAEISNSWSEPMTSLCAALPIWIFPYIQKPTGMYSKHHSERMETEYTFVEITVPGCNPIAAWITPGRDGTVRFEVMEPNLYEDEDTGVWYVSNIVSRHRQNKWAIEQTGDWDIAVTLFRAHDAYLNRLELEAQAEERNAYEPETLLVAAPEPEPEPAPAIPDPIDQARQLVNMLSNNMPVKHIMGSDDPSDQDDSRTLVLASVGLAIAYHVSRVADALESKGI
jgi:hypothetical protein